MVKNSTILIRVRRDVINDLRRKYPGVRDADLINMMYNTSLLRAEIKLDKMDFMNKIGTFIYGKAWKK